MIRRLFPIIALAGAARAQVYQMAAMNASEIGALDRSRTVILMPGGIMEEHGPYLPAYTDGYADRHYAERLAAAISARPGWKVVVFPEIPLGFGGANNIGARWSFPGTYTVRLSTLRSVYLDLADDFGQQHFRWIMIVHDHGDPAHNRVLDQASDYFRDVYGGTMVHLFGLAEVQHCYDILTNLLGAAAATDNGLDIHAGAEEHSEMLFLHPELVAPGYAQARSVAGKNFVDLYSLAEASDWPGYFGAPRHASAAFGEQLLDNCARTLNGVALRVLDGLDPRTLERSYSTLDPRDSIGDVAERYHDRVVAARQRKWMEARRPMP